jgi:Uma2 family endonuclease
MSKPGPKPWSLAEFLAWEELQEDRYELVDGVVFAMAGGTQAHATIAGNVFARLHEVTRGGPCRAFGSDLKIVSKSFSAYPDVSVVCGKLRDELTVAEEPLLVVEVLSRSTRDRDYGAKWLSYREIPTLRYYLLIDQEERRLEIFVRHEGGWRTSIVTDPTEAIELPELRTRLTVAEVYEGTALG